MLLQCRGLLVRAAAQHQQATQNQGSTELRILGQSGMENTNMFSMAMQCVLLLSDCLV